MPDTDRKVLVGEIGRAHGVRGEVRLTSYTEEPAAIAGYGPLATGDGRAVVIERARALPGHPAMLIVTLHGVRDRDAAAGLNRARLYLPRERLASADPEEDEFLAADLVGLAVTDTRERPVGRVAAVPNYGGGDILEIAPEVGGTTILAPFTKAFVPVVDVAGGRLVVDADALDALLTPERPEPGEDDG